MLAGAGTTPDKTTNGLEDLFRAGQCPLFEQAEQEEVLSELDIPMLHVFTSI